MRNASGHGAPRPRTPNPSRGRGHARALERDRDGVNDGRDPHGVVNHVLGQPGVEDRLLVRLHADLVRGVRNGTLDAALLALEAEIGDVEREVIARDPFVLATPPRHPLGTPTTPARTSELREAPVLLLDDGHCFRDQVLAVCSRARVREGEFRATSLPTLAQMVAGGGGVTLLPKLAVATEAGRSGLRVRAFVDPAPHRTIGLVWRRSSPHGAALHQVAATIRTAYPKEKH